MKIASSRQALDETMAPWRDAGEKIGFVPTMGALHDGHLSLIDLARREGATRVVASVFVNPAQFAPHEDFDTYPRDNQGDADKLRAAGADLVYFPASQDIYPDGQDTEVRAGNAAKGLESDFRPHFFDGVVNVVDRLFSQVNPHLSVFGEKDYQQLCVIREMVASQGKKMRVIGAPIMRDAHGLALSSRNAYLSPGSVQIARRLNRVLHSLAAAIETAPLQWQELLQAGCERLIESGFESVDYLTLRDAFTLAPCSPESFSPEGQSAADKKQKPARLLATARVQGVRLLDNWPLWA